MVADKAHPDINTL